MKRLSVFLRSAGLPCLAAMSLAGVASAAPAAAETSAGTPVAVCELATPCTDKLPVKVVLVTMFEIGEDTGDAPGEFQIWHERRGLTTRIPFPHSYHDLYYNPETQVLAMVTGIGTAKSAGATMALGLDPRFDLAKAYWLVAGIAGIDPQDASIGSAAWASYLVDGDLAHEIDAREIPKDWPSGYFARETKGPLDTHRPEPTGELFVANPALRDWAYDLTKDIALPDDPAIAEERARFTGYPNALKPPIVMKGDTVSAMTFWHGARMNDWANEWVDYWSQGQGNFVTSAMEDTGTAQSLAYLDKLGVVDYDRLMVLRAGSNFTMPPPGVSPADYLLRENEGYAGMTAALESLYLVGGKVVDELLGHWDKYATTVPGSK